MRKALREALAEARESGRMTPEHEIRATLAERYAAIVDQAARDGESRELLTAGGKLVDLLDTLPIRKPRGVSGDGSGSGGDNVRDLFEAGPTLGDAAHT